MDYRDFSVKLKLIISLFQTVKLSLLDLASPIVNSFGEMKIDLTLKNPISCICGTPEGAFPFRYLSEKKLKQGNWNGNQKKKYLV